MKMKKKIRTLLCSCLLVWAAPNAVVAQEFIEFIELRGVAPTDVFDFVFVDDVGNATTHMASDSDGDGIIVVEVPSAASGKHVHIPSCASILLENVLLDDVSGSSSTDAVTPFFTDGTGQSLMPIVNVSELGTTPAFTVGQTIEVVDGISGAYPAATFRAPGVPFHEIPHEDFGQEDRFPLFTGTATVVELLDIRVVIVPEPTSILLLVLGTIIVAGRQRSRWNLAK
jgi:hypothetical protein